jgi:hypothetical protein
MTQRELSQALDSSPPNGTALRDAVPSRPADTG